MLSIAEIKAIVAAALLLFAAVGGAVIAHKFDDAKYEKLVAEQATAAQAALQAALDQQKQYDEAALAAAQTEARRQAAFAAEANARQQEVRVHVVTKYLSRTCVPYGIIRVLDAAATSRLAADLPLPSGKSDDACAPVTWDDLAQAIIANYDAANANAEQLNALIDFINQMAKLHGRR